MKLGGAERKERIKAYSIKTCALILMVVNSPGKKNEKGKAPTKLDDDGGTIETRSSTFGRTSAIGL